VPPVPQFLRARSSRCRYNLGNGFFYSGDSLFRGVRMAGRAAGLLFALSFCLAPPAAQGALVPVRLRCEYAVDPLGVDVARPRLSWIVQSDERGARQTAYEVLVASSAERLAADEGDLWASGKVASDETVNIPYGGRELASSAQAFWKVRVWDAADKASEWSVPATWTMGVMRPDDWRGLWIVAPWQTESLLVRREFAVKPGLKRAIVHVCGLGQFEMTVNGRKSGAGLLAPGWSKYDKTCLYETHDVTPLVREGANAVGLALGDGMYHVERRNRFSKFQGTFGPQRAIGQIELEYADGTREVVGTDEQWRVHAGPVTYNDVYGGEDFDARLVQAGWDSAGFDDAKWASAVILVRPSGTLRGMTASAPAIQAIETMEPKSTTRLDDDTDVVDLGQNASYMPRITVTGPAGSTVRLTHAELLHDDGTINRDTCGGNRGPAWWQYTKATDGEETWFPQFFYAGCRYLQVDKLPAAPGAELPRLVKLDGVVVHSTAEPVGEFECSNDTLNRIRQLVRWAQRSNMVSVLTDCPHREKLGWLEQYHLNGAALRYEFDVSRIFRKSMRDMADSQLDSGLIPNIAPEYTRFDGTFRAAAEWGAAFFLVPWQEYQFTGDASLLREYYEPMKRYLAYLGSRAKDHILDEGLGDWYDLGPADRPGGAQLTPPEITATAFYSHCADVLARIAGLTGHSEDREKYSSLANDVRSAWRQKFHDPATGKCGTDSQCSYALALQFVLAEPPARASALAALVQDIQERGNGVTAGDVGYGPMLNALAEDGRSDVIFDMLMQDDKPGYAYQLRKGETSLTEAWDANPFSSHNHFMLGQVTEWLYGDVAGIRGDPSGPGFKKVIIRPTPVGDLTWAKASYQSIRGKVVSSWRRENGRLTLELSIPANMTATLYLPAKSIENMTESGRPAHESEGVKYLRVEGDRAVFELSSGKFEFGSKF
jgi:hypothetical protein